MIDFAWHEFGVPGYLVLLDGRAFEVAKVLGRRGDGPVTRNGLMYPFGRARP
jgi:hypothetical protein